MKILVGCEESQAVTIELRKLGHEAYSCDLIESSGGYSVGFNINGDFITLDNLKPLLIKIKKTSKNEFNR